MKPSFSLKWLFAGMAVVALSAKALTNPNSHLAVLLAVVLNTAVFTSFAIGAAIWLAKGPGCPLMVRSYVVIGLLVFISPVFFVWWPLLPNWLGKIHSLAVDQFAGSFGRDRVFSIVHCWFTVAVGLLGACLIQLLFSRREPKP